VMKSVDMWNLKFHPLQGNGSIPFKGIKSKCLRLR
jgi:hypothetical protein